MGKKGLRCVVYTRVSHENQRQADGGKSLRMQQEKAKAWIELHDAVLVKVCTDEAVSAKSLKGREGFQDALHTLYRNEADALIIYSLSRAFRSTQDALKVSEGLNRRGKVLVSLTEQLQTNTAMGKFYLTLLASLAELERNLLGERVKSVMDNKRANSERLGTLPYGYTLSDDGVHLKPDASEQATIAYIQRLRGEGLSFEAVSRRLNAERIPCKNAGSRWNKGTVCRITKANEEVSRC
jgi:site-specific DNA recombinase